MKEYAIIWLLDTYSTFNEEVSHTQMDRFNGDRVEKLHLKGGVTVLAYSPYSFVVYRWVSGNEKEDFYFSKQGELIRFLSNL